MAEITQVIGGVLAGVAASSAPARKTAESQARKPSANAMLQGLDVALRFRVERDSDSVKILVVDRSTGAVVRTIPPDYFATAVGLKGLVLDDSL